MYGIPIMSYSCPSLVADTGSLRGKSSVEQWIAPWNRDGFESLPGTKLYLVTLGP